MRRGSCYTYYALLTMVCLLWLYVMLALAILTMASRVARRLVLALTPAPTPTLTPTLTPDQAPDQARPAVPLSDLLPARPRPDRSAAVDRGTSRAEASPQHPSPADSAEAKVRLGVGVGVGVGFIAPLAC